VAHSQYWMDLGLTGSRLTAMARLVYFDVSDSVLNAAATRSPSVAQALSLRVVNFIAQVGHPCEALVQQLLFVVRVHVPLYAHAPYGVTQEQA
jgi:hypothetical protein